MVSYCDVNNCIESTFKLVIESSLIYERNKIKDPSLWVTWRRGTLSCCMHGFPWLYVICVDYFQF